jgi:hypothetical protein
MNDDYFKQQADRIRAMADKADPFTRKRLLDLAERYDAKLGRPSRATRQLRLPQEPEHSSQPNAPTGPAQQPPDAPSSR